MEKKEFGGRNEWNETKLGGHKGVEAKIEKKRKKESKSRKETKGASPNGERKKS